MGLTWLTGSGLTVIQDSGSERTIAIRDSFHFAMAEIIFPNEWWTLPLSEYEEHCVTLKGLTGKDLDVGTKDVSFIFDVSVFEL